MIWSSALFYLAFCCQIFLISDYFPKRMVANIDHVLANFPPETHPKLYIGSFESFLQTKNRFALACRCIVIGGLLLIPALMFLVEHKTGIISPVWPVGYSMLQILPFMALALSEFSYLKQMRKMSVLTKRVAELRRRTLSDYIHPLLIVCAVALWVTYVLVDFYVNKSADGWSSDSVKRVGLSCLMNIGILAFGALKLNSQKLDPHQSNQTQARNISFELTALTFASMAVSVLFAVSAIVGELTTNPFGALIVSIHMQVTAVFTFGYMIRKLHPRKQDFDVYRKDSATG